MTSGAAPAGRRPTRNPFLLITFVDALGTGAFSAAAVVLFSRLLAMGGREVSTGLAIAGLVAAVLIVPVGRLFEGVPTRTAMSALNAALALTVLGVLQARSLPLFVVVMGALGLLQRAVSAVRGAALARCGEDRVRLRAQNRAAFNLGLALGSGLAAGFVATGSRAALTWLVVIDATSYLACAVLSRSLDAARPGTTGPRFQLTSVRDGRYLLACLLNTVGCLHNSLIFVAVPLWVLRTAPGAAWVIPVCSVVNTALVVALQQRLARGVDGLERALSVQNGSGLLLLGACVLLAAPGQARALVLVPVVVVGVGVLTLAEVRQSAASWEVAYALAPAERITEYQALFGLSSTAETVVGPLVAGWIVGGNGGVPWIVVGVVVIVLLRGGTGILTHRGGQAAHAMTPSGTEQVRGGSST